MYFSLIVLSKKLGFFINKIIQNKMPSKARKLDPELQKVLNILIIDRLNLKNGKRKMNIECGLSYKSYLKILNQLTFLKLLLI